jgi:hypothetical protein
MTMIKSVNLLLHFILELCALAALSYWGFKSGDSSWMKVLLGVGLPILAAVIWGSLRVPNDPGPALIAVNGRLRLAIEWGLFAGATAALFTAGRPMLAWTFGAAAVIDYALMYERVMRLLR